MPALKDLTGMTFDRLIVLNRDGYKGVVIAWKCRCTCGKETVVTGGSLTSGNTRSCGCIKREQTTEIFTKHGCAGNRRAEGRTREYRIWIAMKTRCSNPRQRSWANYGGRGIRVCKRWLNSFAAFLGDMGPCPTGMSIDRYPDKDGNYKPSNCRWATSSQQAFNRHLRHPVTFRGITDSILGWSSRSGLPVNAIVCRLRNNWSVDRALTQELRITKRSCESRTASPIR